MCCSFVCCCLCIINCFERICVNPGFGLSAFHCFKEVYLNDDDDDDDDDDVVLGKGIRIQKTLDKRKPISLHASDDIF